jgi:hypothetical protein
MLNVSRRLLNQGRPVTLDRPNLADRLMRPKGRLQKPVTVEALKPLTIPFVGLRTTGNAFQVTRIR